MPHATSIFPLSSSPFRSGSAAGTPVRVVNARVGCLTTRLVAGDEAAWTEVHQEYAPRLFRYLLVVTGGREDQAADALQATWLRCVRHIRRFDSEEAFWSWLTVLARSSLTDEHRRQNRLVSFLQRFLETRPEEPAGPSLDADTELLAMLETGMQQLPLEERGLLEAKYLHRQSTRELASELAATEKAVESRLARARLKVREIVLQQLRKDHGNED